MVAETQSHLEREIVHVLFIDVVGYSKYTLHSEDH